MPIKHNRATYEKNYSKELQEKIDSIILTTEQLEKLNWCMKRMCPVKHKYLKPAFEDIYKLYIADVSTSDLSKIYNTNIRTIQLMLKEFGLQRDRFKAQSIAVKKRNYVEVRKTYKKTMAKRLTRNQLTGSQVENVVRHDLNMRLHEMFPNYFVIVGVNTMTNVGELDIPIAIYKESKLYKFGVEVDGKLFHKDDTRQIKDNKKTVELEKIGYKMFRLNTKAYFTSGEGPFVKYKHEIETKLDFVCDEIQKYILEN